MPRTSLVPSFVLVWPSNSGWGSLTEMTAVSPSRRSSPVTLGRLALGVLVVGGDVAVDRARQRGAEADQVRAALDRVDVVRERVDALVVGVVVLERDLDATGVSPSPSLRRCVAAAAET